LIWGTKGARYSHDVASFVRKVKTASGATAVQIVDKRAGVRRIVEHLGSAHDEAELAVLMQVARERLNAGQDGLDLGLDTPAPAVGARARVVAGSSQVLWDVLVDAYQRLGFTVLDDEAFMKLVLARVIEPVSKADTVRVLHDLGVGAPDVNTLHAALARAQARDYRGQLATACRAHSTRTTGTGALVLYDVTTLHFETEAEDDLRKVADEQGAPGGSPGPGRSARRPRRVPPGGAPVRGQQGRDHHPDPGADRVPGPHDVTDMVVVADAGMLSAANLGALEDAGFSFIVGSRITKAPYDLADHFERHGNYFTDAQILESSRVMGTGKAARTRRVVYQWKFKRNKHDDRAINAMIERAEKIAAGRAPLKRARFLKITSATKALDQATIDRARQLAALLGYVTNLPIETMDGAAVINAYHDLWRVEQSFRMTKSDLRARPVFHHRLTRSRPT